MYESINTKKLNSNKNITYVSFTSERQFKTLNIVLRTDIYCLYLIFLVAIKIDSLLNSCGNSKIAIASLHGTKQKYYLRLHLYINFIYFFNYIFFL